MERIGGVAAGVAAAQAAESGEELVGARDRGGVQVAFAGDAADGELGAPVAALHALLPVKPEDAFGGGWNAFGPEPLLQRTRTDAKVLLTDELAPGIPGACAFNRHDFSLALAGAKQKITNRGRQRLTRWNAVLTLKCQVLG